jgi:hypothetical protein
MEENQRCSIARRAFKAFKQDLENGIVMLQHKLSFVNRLTAYNTKNRLEKQRIEKPGSFSGSSAVTLKENNRPTVVLRINGFVESLIDPWGG